MIMNIDNSTNSYHDRQYLRENLFTLLGNIKNFYTLRYKQPNKSSLRL